MIDIFGFDNIEAGEGIFKYDDKIYHKSCINYETLKKHIKEFIIFDVGCYDGGDSLRFSKWFPNAKVYAFEACPHNYKKINVVKDIHYYNIAVMDYTGYIDFTPVFLNGESYGCGTCFETTETFKNAFPCLEYKDKISVPCITIDDFCQKNNITHIDFISIDVEGGSVNVLEGMKNIKPDIIYIEREGLDKWKNKNTKTINQIMNERGYQMIKEYTNDNLYKKI